MFSVRNGVHKLKSRVKVGYKVDEILKFAHGHNRPLRLRRQCISCEVELLYWLAICSSTYPTKRHA